MNAVENIRNAGIVVDIAAPYAEKDKKKILIILMNHGEKRHILVGEEEGEVPEAVPG
jgi:hypothetical protein